MDIELLALLCGDLLRDEDRAILSSCDTRLHIRYAEIRATCNAALSIISQLRVTDFIPNITHKIKRFVTFRAHTADQRLVHFRKIWDVVHENFHKLHARNRQELVEFQYLSKIDTFLHIKWYDAYFLIGDPRSQSPGLDYFYSDGNWIQSCGSSVRI